MKVTVIGAGAWGGALAQVLADNGHEVIIWSHSAAEVSDINERQVISVLERKGIKHRLNKGIVATTDLAFAITGAKYLLFVVPSAVFRTVVEQVSPLITTPVVCVSATKGIESGTHKTMTQIIADVLPKDKYDAIVALSGPSHAEEVICRKLTAVVAASSSLDGAKKVQELFNNHVYFRVYVNDDWMSVEIGGALKNIIAILSGIGEGFDIGDNARAALITRGLFEIIRIGVAMGGKERSFLGLAGLGDLIVTTTSHHSRNFQAGELLATGMPAEMIEQEIGASVEGFHAVQAAYEIITEKGLYAPLISVLYDIINGKVVVKEALHDLFNRAMKDEFADM
jgi:glycerol-3-phosphate dehydrogenase (NAD(P)+)